MMDPKEKAAREALQRLVDFLDEEPPTDEEGREAVASMGVDVDAMVARIRARVAEHEAKLAREAVVLRGPSPEREALPFRLRRTPNGRLALAAGLLAAGATGAAAVVVIHQTAPRESDQGARQETARALRPIEEPSILPDAGARGASSARGPRE